MVHSLRVQVSVIKNRVYSVRVDGSEIQQIVLSFDEYKDQPSRDKIREMIADHHGIKTWGLRLQRVDCPYTIWTDMKTGKTHQRKKEN